MTFVMRLEFVDTVCDDSLIHTYVNNQKLGYEFQVRLSYYRGHYLSCIEELKVMVDGEEVDPTDMTFCLNNKEFTMAQIPYLISEFWKVNEAATIKVYAPGGLEDGEHTIDVTLLLRNAYMYVPGNTPKHNYAVLNSSGSKTLPVRVKKGVKVDESN
ncbi:C-glycoside deglycosidase beta subunit domain-containing protein [Priestia sp. GS2]|uniref:C-glycoside deglycosidase beta subunit domain-containing protein n=1 Tax=Priestia sp. GS2 TaxID=3117403 RepID=UPI002EDB18EB